MMARSGSLGIDPPGRKPPAHEAPGANHNAVERETDNNTNKALYKPGGMNARAPAPLSDAELKRRKRVVLAAFLALPDDIRLAFLRWAGPHEALALIDPRGPGLLMADLLAVLEPAQIEDRVECLALAMGYQLTAMEDT